MIDDMIRCCQEDHQTIVDESGPAIARIKLIKEMSALLMKKPIQAEFLDFNGLEALSFWIDQNPDGSYPLPQVVESVFEVLERLPMDSRFLENSRIAKVVSLYAHGKTEHHYLEHRALAII